MERWFVDVSGAQLKGILTVFPPVNIWIKSLEIRDSICSRKSVILYPRGNPRSHIELVEGLRNSANL